MISFSLDTFLDSLKPAIQSAVPDKYQPVLYKGYFMYLQLRSLIYAGGQVTCPCCNGHFIQFVPAKPGSVVLPNEKCPRCDSWKRHRLLWLYLKNKTNLFSENLRVLHIAPEYWLQKALANMTNLNYVSTDLSSPLAMLKMDITNITFEDNCFDVILCNHVLEHIEDDHKAMNELFRVLKPGGWAILQVPLDQKRSQTFEDPTIVSPEERERLFWQYDHVRLYGWDPL